MNDLPLLLYAGEARCPPDAHPEVLAAVAGRIAPSAEHGVACYLQAVLEASGRGSEGSRERPDWRRRPR